MTPSVTSKSPEKEPEEQPQAISLEKFKELYPEIDVSQLDARILLTLQRRAFDSDGQEKLRHILSASWEKFKKSQPAFTREVPSKKATPYQTPMMDLEEFKGLYPEFDVEKLKERTLLAFRRMAVHPHRRKEVKDALQEIFSSINTESQSSNPSDSQAPLGSFSSSSSVGFSYFGATEENAPTFEPPKKPLTTLKNDLSEFDEFLNHPPSLSSSSSSRSMASSESSSSAGESSSSAGSSYLEATTELYRQWFVPSGQPEKERKYIVSLGKSLEVFLSSRFNLEELEQKLQKTFSKDGAPVDLQALARGWKNYYGGGMVEYVWSSGSKSFDLFAYCALKALISAKDYSNIRLQYAAVRDNLREAIATEEYKNQREGLDQKLVFLIQDICHAKFTGTNLFSDWKVFLEMLVGQVEGPLGFGSLSETLEEKNQALHNTPPEYRKELITLNREKLQGTIGVNFDPVGISNVPKIRSEQEVVGRNGIPWKMGRIAHGTPTIEYDLTTKAYSLLTGASNAEIIPEYKAFLSAAKRRKERVFYVNLQQRNGLEADRSAQIEALQREPEFRNTFYSMSIPMDGSAFTKLIQNEVPTKEFKKNVLGLFFTQEGRVRDDLSSAKFPLDLLERIEKKPELGSQIASELNKIISQVHVLYFDGQNLNSPEKRQNFLMQFYSDLTDYMISREYVALDTGKDLEEHERIRWVVQACKDNKDRGGAKNGIDEAKYVLLTYPLDDPEALHQALYDIYVNTLGAYTIKFEEILSNRLVYFTSLLKRYAEIAKDPKKVQRIRDNQPSFFRIKEHKSARYLDSQPDSP